MSDKPDVFTPPASLLAKLGSLVVHVQEYTDETQRHPADWQAMQALVHDPEVEAWVKRMGSLALVPVRRGTGGF